MHSHDEWSQKMSSMTFLGPTPPAGVAGVDSYQPTQWSNFAPLWHPQGGGQVGIFSSNDRGGGPNKTLSSIFGSLVAHGGVHTSYSIRILLPLLAIFLEYRVQIRDVEYSYKGGGG